jgi:hypothetical protein
VLSGNKFANTNRDTSGERTAKPVPAGSAPLQLYTLATPNGQKVGILLEVWMQHHMRIVDHSDSPLSWSRHRQQRQFLPQFSLLATQTLSPPLKHYRHCKERNATSTCVPIDRTLPHSNISTIIIIIPIIMTIIVSVATTTTSTNTAQCPTLTAHDHHRHGNVITTITLSTVRSSTRRTLALT